MIQSLYLGPKFTRSHGLTPLTKGFSKLYRDDFDPSLPNAFSAAAMRVGHTCIPDLFKTFSTLEKRARERISLDLQVRALPCPT